MTDLAALFAALAAPDAADREAAARALGETADALDRAGALDDEGRARIDAALTSALDDDDYGVRQSAAEMIVRVAGAARGAAYALLVGDLDADDAEVQLGAAWSLKALGDHRAAPAFVRLTGHWQPNIWTAAAIGLAELGDARAIPPLERALEDPTLDPMIGEVAAAMLDRLHGR
jgi:HEAT repeat protein